MTTTTTDPHLTRTQATILRLLTIDLGGYATDSEIDKAYATIVRVPLLAPSTLRSRRAELVDMGLVTTSSDQGISRFGRSCTVWKPTPDGSLLAHRVDPSLYAVDAEAEISEI